MSIFGLKGKFRVQLFDKVGKLLRDEIVPNGITNQGLDSVLDIMFNAAAQATSWYTGLIDSVGYTSLNVNDTMSAHAGWLEYQNYTEGTRPLWNPDSADDQVIINPDTAYIEFTITGNPTLKGIFIVSDNVKGGSAGILWSTALFSNSNVGEDWSVSDGQVLRIQYQVTAQSA